MTTGMSVSLAGGDTFLFLFTVLKLTPNRDAPVVRTL